jgi:hypothetical protein
MKRMTNKMMTAAAVLMIGAGVASAQTALTAEIPFAFSAGQKVTEPGAYRVRNIQGSAGLPIFVLRNEATGSSSLMVAKLRTDVPAAWKADGKPRVAFDCSSGACALVKIWYGEDRAYSFPGPRVKSGEVQLTEILLKSGKGD